ncbi:hypothetical protein niasHS_001397 [Heterodera schachtii]|uniref:CCHC-type domain-containing protein n=1 Tax=Heterodera schachtii TaxID=97005 RepID=A0ABD2KDD5_HETSC
MYGVYASNISQNNGVSSSNRASATRPRPLADTFQRESAVFYRRRPNFVYRRVYRCPCCREPGQHYVRDCPVDKGQANLSLFNKQCMACKLRGHYPSNCEILAAWRSAIKNGEGVPARVLATAASAFVPISTRCMCFACQRADHLTRHCPHTELKDAFYNFVYHAPTSQRTTRLEIAEYNSAGRLVCKELRYEGRNVSARKAEEAALAVSASAFEQWKATSPREFEAEKERRARQLDYEQERISASARLRASGHLPMEDE